jgi:proteasome accessory factor C
VASKAITARRRVCLEYWKETRAELTVRTVEPYGLVNGREGWYLHAYDLGRDAERSFRLDRVKNVTVLAERFEPRPGIDPARLAQSWPRTGKVPAAARARLWVAASRAGALREDHTVVAELSDGSIVVEVLYADTGWLVAEVLREAGDVAVLEPADTRRAVLEATNQHLAAHAA